MLVLARKRHHLIDFGRRNITGKNPANPGAFAMNLEHNLCRLFAAVGEELLNYDDYEVEVRRHLLAVDPGCGFAPRQQGVDDSPSGSHCGYLCPHGYQQERV